MGMFDTILGNQVKCFHDDFSGGSLSDFKYGDKVPYKTDYYDYTENFNILLTDEESETGKPVLIKIRDGKVYSVKDIEITVLKDWDGLCINKYGKTIRINSKEIAQEYSDCAKQYYKEKFEYMRENISKSKKIFNLSDVSTLSDEERKIREEELNRKRKEEMDNFYSFITNLREKHLSKFF